MSTAPMQPGAKSLTAPGEIVARVVADEAAHTFGSALRAVILTGSLARGEVAFVRRGEKWYTPSDAEFLLLLESGHRGGQAQALEGRIRAALEKEGVSCQVDATPTHARYLRALRPHIFAYELRTCGRVIRGDQDTLDLIPPFEPDEIPLEDGWRLLSNRMVEMLEWPASLPVAGDPLPEEIGYRALKLCLDTATSLLLFRGAYAPTFRARAEALKQLEARGIQEVPFPLGPFRRAVEDLTRVKLDGSAPLPTWDLWRSIVGWALRLWDYQLNELSGRRGFEPTAAMEHFARRQPFNQKARGWLSFWRSAGGLGALYTLPRIVSLVRAGSPRLHVYRIASQLLAELPDLVPVCPQIHGDPARWHRFRRQLPDPAPRRPSSECPAWLQLADDIVRHYRRFLVKTRS